MTAVLLDEMTDMAPPKDVIAAAAELGDRFLNPIEEVDRQAVARYAFRPERLSPAESRRGAAIPANVHAVGVGRKEVTGKPEKDFAVRIHVIAKVANRYIPLAQRIPPSIGGIPVDVVVSSPAVRVPLARTRAVGRKGRRAGAPRVPVHDPLVAGISVGHTTGLNSGTIGYFVRSTLAEDPRDTALLLSNHHVLADSFNAGMKGDPIVHPGTLDGGNANDHQVASFHRAFPVQALPAPNLIDAAVALLKVAYVPEIRGIGKIRGRAPVAGNMDICKSGRTSSYTTGVVSDYPFEVLVYMDENDHSLSARFEDQIRIRRTGKDKRRRIPFLGEGDSGSLIVARHLRDGNATPLAVGLLFAGSRKGSYGVANRIEHVEKKLHVELIL